MPYRNTIEKKLYRCEVLAKAALEVGNFGEKRNKLTEELLYKHWEKEEILPDFSDITIGNVKWFLKEKMEWNDPVWTSDFLQGLVKVGYVMYNKQTFPTFAWNSCPHIWDFIDEAPFGGGKTTNEKINQHYWRAVPALHLKSNNDSVHYVAGLMAGLRRVDNSKGITYARASSNLLPHIKALGIPIDHKTRSDIGNGISPIWPMIFEPYMPVPNTQWDDVKNPLNGELYATILWKTYVSNTFVSKGLPFLPSRRTIFNRHKEYLEKNGDDYWMGRKIGALKRIEKLRVKHNLVSLDPRIVEAVKNYAKDYAEKKKEMQ